MSSNFLGVIAGILWFVIFIVVPVNWFTDKVLTNVPFILWIAGLFLHFLPEQSLALTVAFWWGPALIIGCLARFNLAKLLIGVGGVITITVNAWLFQVQIVDIVTIAILFIAWNFIKNPPRRLPEQRQ